MIELKNNSIGNELIDSFTKLPTRTKNPFSKTFNSTDNVTLYRFLFPVQRFRFD